MQYLLHPGPVPDRIDGTHHVHAGRGEAPEGRIGGVRIIDNVRNHHRCGAVLEQIDLAGERPVTLEYPVQQVIYGPGNAVALGLPGDDDGIEPEQGLVQRLVFSGDLLPVGSDGDLGAEHRIVLGQRVVSLDMEIGLAVAGDTVEIDGLLDGRDQRVADAAQHRVIGPDGEVVLAGSLQPARVIEQVPLTVLEIDAQTTRHLGVELPAALLDVLYANQRERFGVPAIVIDEIDGVEDLHCLVRIQCRDHPGDPVQVAIQEGAQAAAVIDRTGTGASAYIELEIRYTEGVLGIDDEQADAARVSGGRPDAVPRGPLPGFPGPHLVGDAPHGPDPIGCEMGWDGKRVG